MPVDQETQAVLDLLEQLGAADFSELSVQEARNLSLTPPPERPAAVGSVEDRSVPTAEADIPIRIYRPESGGTQGALLFFHGGGWVIGDLESHDETCRILCAQAGLTVVAVHYRRAPESPYPAALTDCFAATRWVADNAELLGVDAKRLGVGGDSAGGNLAAAVALKARDEGQPGIACQLLIYPVTDANFDTVSYQENAEGYLLTKKGMQWFWDHYVPVIEDRAQAYASPLRADTLENLPPALVQTAEFDPLRDEGEAYTEMLKGAGNTVQHTRYDGLIHGYFGMQATVSKANVAIEEAVGFLKQHLN